MSYTDSVSIRMELHIPSLQVTSMINTHNAKIEEQVKIGIDNAIKKLEDGNTLSGLVEEEVIKGVVKAVTDGVSGYEAMRQLRETINQSISAEVGKFSDRIIEKVREQLS